jgi:hypothetical protein
VDLGRDAVEVLEGVGHGGATELGSAKGPSAVEPVKTIASIGENNNLSLRTFPNSLHRVGDSFNAAREASTGLLDSACIKEVIAANRENGLATSAAQCLRDPKGPDTTILFGKGDTADGAEAVKGARGHRGRGETSNEAGKSRPEFLPLGPRRAHQLAGEL